MLKYIIKGAVRDTTFSLTRNHQGCTRGRWRAHISLKVQRKLSSVKRGVEKVSDVWLKPESASEEREPEIQ